MNKEINIDFLANFIDEGIYLTDIITETIVKEPVVEINNLSIDIKIEPENIVLELPQTNVQEIKKVSTPTILENKKSDEKPKTYKKVVVLVSYPDGIPTEVFENLYLTFSALEVQKSDIDIKNVIIATPSLLEDYDFDFLILMGGNGKSLNILKNLEGKRDFYEIINLGNSKIIFVQKMEIYLLAENKPLKIKYWQTLKKAFGKL